MVFALGSEKPLAMSMAQTDWGEGLGTTRAVVVMTPSLACGPWSVL